jgi:ABC-type antimicrobial peptide transport system permease subunit
MHYIESLLYGVKPLDPATFSGCALLMFLVSMLAVLIPVHRAMALDPIAALKDD